MDLRNWSGTLMVLDTWTADGRRVATPLISLRHRDLPIPLVMRNPPGSLDIPEPVGTIDTVTLLPADDVHDTDRADPPRVWATGKISPDLVRDIDPQYADRLEAGEPCGIGVDLDQVVSVHVDREPAPRAADSGPPDADPLAVVFREPATPPAADLPGEQINGWRIMAAHLHDAPTWPQCVITLDAP